MNQELTNMVYPRLESSLLLVLSCWPCDVCLTFVLGYRASAASGLQVEAIYSLTDI